jgi:hypothetical protein
VRILEDDIGGRLYGLADDPVRERRVPTRVHRDFEILGRERSFYLAKAT